MQRLWRSRTRYQPSKVQQIPMAPVQQNYLLPNQIGCRIIQLQMQIMQIQNLNKQIILQLLHEYSVIYFKAIQFYEQRGCNKHLMYQKRLQIFLHKSAVAQILKGKTGTLLIKKQKNQQQLKKAHTQSQIVAKKLIQQSTQSGKKQQDNIKKQLQNQQKHLEERIQRKRAMSGKSNKTEINSQKYIKKQQQINDKKLDDILVSEFNVLSTNNNSGNKKSNLKVFL